MSCHRVVETFEDCFQSYEGMALVGTVGGGFSNTTELKVVKYDEAMKSGDVDKWHDAVQEEHNKFKKTKVDRPVPRSNVPRWAKILTSTWAMKKKPNVVFRARLNARGFEQRDGEHYFPHDNSAPVTNDFPIRIV